MENNRVNVPFYVAVFLFLALIIVLIKDFDARRANDFKEYVANITFIENQKNNKIRMLYNMLMVQEKANEDLKNTLAETKNDIDSLSKKLTSPATTVAPVTANATAPVPVTK